MNAAPDKNDLINQAAGKALPASEATQIEVQRAIAQVQGALLLARANPRDTVKARERIKEACSIHELAAAAFFLYKRSGSQVTGPSIKLACELARCWGNIDYGVVELSRSDDKGESEMLAVAWDLETNTRSSTSFIVPHKRDKRGGATVLTDLRDIYENNANAAARRLREMILKVIPHEVVEEAKAICRQTIEHGNGVDLPERRKNCLAAFEALHVTREQIERKIGRVLDIATAQDLAALEIVYRSIQNNETTVSEHFEDDRAPEIEDALTKNREAGGEADQGDEVDPDEKLLSDARDVASLGKDALQNHWKTLSQPQRRVVNRIMKELTDTAKLADGGGDGDEPPEDLFTDDEEPAQEDAPASPPAADDGMFRSLSTALNRAESVMEVEQTWKDNAEKIEALPPEQRKELAALRAKLNEELMAPSV